MLGVAKKRFSERSLPGKAAAASLIASSLAVVVSAERDLQRRPESDVRGPKNLWRLVSLNAVGAGAYLRFGRRG